MVRKIAMFQTVIKSVCWTKNACMCIALAFVQKISDNCACNYQFTLMASKFLSTFLDSGATVGAQTISRFTHYLKESG